MTERRRDATRAGGEGDRAAAKRLVGSRLVRYGGPATALILFGLAIVAVNTVLRDYRLRDIVAAAEAIPAITIAASIGFTAASYLALAGYDLSALRWIRAKVPLSTALLASFTGYAVGNSIGFALISGGSIRYRIYTAAGVPSLDVGRLVLFCTATFALGIAAVGSLGILLDTERLARLLDFSASLLQAGAITILAILGAIVLAQWVVPMRISIRRWTVGIPGPGLILFQTALSAIDIACAAAALYVLLPDAAPIGFAAFLGIYATATMAGLLSQVPGGIGVFESIILIALLDWPGEGGPDPVEGTALAGALIVFRVIYYLLPLILAGALLGRYELTRLPTASVTLRIAHAIASRIAPRALAVLVFAAGTLMLISGAVPELSARIREVRQWVPLPILELSHLIASLAGLAMLILARGLQQRLRIAWWLAIALLLASAGLAITKGGNALEAGLLLVLAAIVLPFRRRFYRQSRLTDMEFTSGWIAAVLGVVVGTGWLVLFAFRNVDYSSDVWWRFAFYAQAPRSLRALLLVSVAMVALGLLHLLRTAPGRHVLPTPEDLEQCTAILCDSSQLHGNLVFLRDKSVLFSPDREGFLMYGIRGRSWIAMGDPIGSDAVQEDLVWQFRETCDRAGARPAFYQVEARRLPLYVDAGLVPMKLGEEAIVDLAGFSLEGSRRKPLRNNVKRAERQNLTFEIVPPERFGELLPDLQAISDEWLGSRRVAEKGFSLGFFDPDYLSRYPIALVRRAGDAVAFANVWLGSPGTEVSVDLMRQSRSAPGVTMDFLFAHLMLWCRDAGFRQFSLGMAPLSGLETHPLAPSWHRIGTLMFQRGGQLYNFQGLRAYKEKFDPVWESRYLCCSGGLAPAQVLIDVASLIAGGMRRILRL